MTKEEIENKITEIETFLEREQYADSHTVDQRRRIREKEDELRELKQKLEEL